MTFLELCQDMAREATVTGTIATVVDQTGEALRVVNWVAKAYVKIQNEHSDWTFLRNDVLFPTVATLNNYAAAAAATANGGPEFGEWLFAPGWRCYLSASGVADEQPVRYCSYDVFRRRYGYGNARLDTGRPQVVTEKPDRSLLFWPIPNAVYQVVGEQYRAPHNFTANGDNPVFPAKFHQAIVQRALMLYAEFEGDATVFGAAQTEYIRILGEMENKYLPDWEDPEPMA